MKKIAYPIFSFVLLIFINGCTGYEPIFSSKNLQFKIANFSIEGDKILGNKIYSKLYSISKSTKNDLDVRNIDLLIRISKIRNATSKDSAGKILEYKITVNTEVQIKDFTNDDKILNQTFTSSSTYKVQDQQSDTVNLENRTIEDLMDNTYKELLIKLSQSISER